MYKLGKNKAKFLIWLFHFLFGTGITIMGVVATIVGYNKTLTDKIIKFSDVTKDYMDGQDIASYGYTGIAVLIVGVIIISASFLRCCLECMNGRCVVYLSAISIVIFSAAQVTPAVVAFNKRNELETEVKTSAFASLNTTKENDVAMTRWNELQQHVHCCGVDNSDDWRNTAGTPYYNTTVSPFWPDSCCVEFAVNCSTHGGAASAALSWQNGCYDRMHDQLEPYILIIAWCSIASLVNGILLAALVQFCTPVPNQKVEPTTSEGVDNELKIRETVEEL